MCDICGTSFLVMAVVGNYFWAYSLVGVSDIASIGEFTKHSDE